MNIRKFHIYSADLNPQFGTEPGKIRPVVVIQTDLLNNFHPSTIICPITSKVRHDISLLRVHIAHTESKLAKDSDILIDQIRAIDNKRFIKEIGHLPDKLKLLLLENLKILMLD